MAEARNVGPGDNAKNLAELISLGERKSAALLALVAFLQTADRMGWIELGLTTWRPTLFAYVLWSVCLCWSQVIIRGEQGKRVLFVLPAALFVVSMVVFPLLFGLTIAFSDWNLSSAAGRKFNGLDNVRQMIADPFYWNAMRNMVWYIAAILVEYIIAFGLALLLAGQIRARKFFRVAFLLPLMLSPVAVSWMVGKSMLEPRFGPLARLARELGWDRPSFFGTPEIAKATIMIMDAWTFIPFMMIMILAGLQAIPKEVQEAARVDGASPWQTFWLIMLPTSLPIFAIVFILAFIGLIGEYPLASVVLQQTNHWTLAVGANSFLYEQNYLWGDFAATAVLSGLPITLLFLACQKLLVSGLTAGGVKE